MELLILAFETLAERNTTGDLTELLVYTNDVTSGLFSPLILFAFFMIILLGSFFSQKRLGRDADFAVSFAVAGFLTAGLSYIMMLRDGLLSPFVGLITTFIAIIGVAWLWFSRN